MPQSMSRGTNIKDAPGALASARAPTVPVIGIYAVPPAPGGGVALAGEVVRCAHLTEFKNAFGGFVGINDEVANLRHGGLVHAVQSYFSQGGSRCYVARVTSARDVERALSAGETIGGSKPDFQQSAMSVIRNIGGLVWTVWNSSASSEPVEGSEPDYQQSSMSVIRNVGGLVGPVWSSGAEVAMLVSSETELVVFRICRRLAPAK